jgi:hypothetical protein
MTKKEKETEDGVEDVVPARRRLGMLKGQFQVPDDFDRMGEREIEELFYGEAETEGGEGSETR